MMKRGKYEEMAADARKKGQAAEVTVSFLKLDNPGAGVVGQLKGLQRVKGSDKGGSYLQYLIESDAGLVKVSFGNAYDREMTPILHIGCVYQWIYQGKRNIANGHMVNDIKTILVDESESGELLLNYIEKNLSSGEGYGPEED